MNDLRPYEAALEIGVDLAGGLRRLGALRYRPCADLLGASGQEAYEPQQTVARLYELVEAAFADAQFLDEELFFLKGEGGKLLLDLGGNDYYLRALLGGLLADLFDVFGLRAYLVLRDVRGVYDGLGGQKEEQGDLLALLVRHGH